MLHFPCCTCYLVWWFVLNQFLISFDFVSDIVRLTCANEVNHFKHHLIPRFVTASLATLSSCSFPSMPMCHGIQGISIFVSPLTSSCAGVMMRLASHSLGSGAVRCRCAITIWASFQMWNFVHAVVVLFGTPLVLTSPPRKTTCNASAIMYSCVLRPRCWSPGEYSGSSQSAAASMSDKILPSRNQIVNHPSTVRPLAVHLCVSWLHSLLAWHPHSIV